MKRMFACNWRSAMVLAVVAGDFFNLCAARAFTNTFFNGSQRTNLIVSGTTSDTISSQGYLFTYTRDKLFTGGVGLTNPIGRAVRVLWPDGIEAQAVTAGPTLSKARIDISRQDGQLFAIKTFTAKLLANTAGAGGSIEVMPMINGEDGVPDPFTYNATGIAGNSFTYDTPELTGFDAYKMTLYVDYALMSLTVVDASPPPPVVAIAPLGGFVFELSWPTNATGYALEATSNIQATAWIRLTNNIATNGGLFTIQLDLTGSQRYFQLRK